MTPYTYDMSDAAYKFDDAVEVGNPNVAPEYPHPGLWARAMLEDAGYTISKAAEVLGINRANLNNVLLGPAEDGGNYMRGPSGVAISRELAYRLDALLNEDGEPGDLARLLLARQAAYDWYREVNLRKRVMKEVRARMADREHASGMKKKAAKPAKPSVPPHHDLGIRVIAEPPEPVKKQRA